VSGSTTWSCTCSQLWPSPPRPTEPPAEHHRKHKVVDYTEKRFRRQPRSARVGRRVTPPAQARCVSELHPSIITDPTSPAGDRLRAMEQLEQPQHRGVPSRLEPARHPSCSSPGSARNRRREPGCRNLSLAGGRVIGMRLTCPRPARPFGRQHR